MSSLEQGASAADLSTALARAVETASAYIVSVDARRGAGATGIVWTADGHILAADHTIQREEDIRVGLPDGSSIGATLTARDPASDLALLKVEQQGLTPAPRAATPEVRVGQLVLAVGRTADLGLSASLGVVSSIGGAWRNAHGGRLGGFVRTDAALYPGFSGGPLIDAAGRVVAVNSWSVSRGAGFAIPTDVAEQTAEALRQGGVKQAYIGVATQPVTLPEGAAGAQRTGLMVVTVQPGGPAEQAGLLMGDVLLTADGAPLRDAEELLMRLTPSSVGAQMQLRLLRAGQITEVALTVGERS